MLKQSLLAKVYSTLEKSPFTVADFTVAPGNGKDDLLLLVRFRHSSQYEFQVIVDAEEKYFAIESPGDARQQEAVHLPTLHGFPDRLLIWTRNVRDELRTTLPVYSEIDALRESIEKHIREHVANPEEPFGKEEADELRGKLDELAQMFAELAEKNEITKTELNKLREEVTALKGNLAGFPKGTWYKTAASKLWALSSRIITSAEGRQVLKQAAQKALGFDPNSGG